MATDDFLTVGKTVSVTELCDESTELLSEVIQYIDGIDGARQRISKRVIMPKLRRAAMLNITARALAEQHEQLTGVIGK